MLPRRQRLTARRDFTTTVRSGRRFRSGALVGHVLGTPSDDGPRAGLIVTRAVGNSVQRHRVSRVLRHACTQHLGQLAPGTLIVLRALPGAAARDSRLAEDVAVIIDKATT
jgi:ribonuclease P protein component